MASFPSTSYRPVRFQSYSSKDWEDKRDIITQLYRDEARPLLAVQTILAQRYGFHPKEPIIKKRIKKWNLDRKKKLPDMIYALRIALERETQGKKTVFLIRGRLVTFEEVKHYFRRRRVRDLRTVVSEANDISPTTRIDCRTPEPEDPQNNLSADGVSADHFIVALPDPEQVDWPISTTSNLHQLEQLLYLGRSYYDSIFENPDWKSHEKTLKIGALKTFYHHLSLGQSILESGKIHQAFRNFGHAFDLVRSLIDEQVLLFLPYILRLLLPDRNMRPQEVIYQLLDFVSTLIKEFYPQIRPMQQSLSLLGHMSPYDRGETTKRMFCSVLERVRIQLGSSVDSITGAYILCVRTQSDLPTECLLSNYYLTAIAIDWLVRDADKLFHEEHQMNPTTQLIQGPEKLYQSQKPSGWLSDLKPQVIIYSRDLLELGEVLPRADRGERPYLTDYPGVARQFLLLSSSSITKLYRLDTIRNRWRSLGPEYFQLAVPRFT